MISYSYYDQKYETKVIDLWNKELNKDPIMTSKFRQQILFDENFDPLLCRLAICEDQVIGVCIGMKRKFPYLERGLEPLRGWIVVMFVKAEFQGQNIGTELLSQTEKELKDNGAREITLGAYSPGYFFPGVDTDNYADSIKFFENRGYISGENEFSMCKKLIGHVMDLETLMKLANLENQGYRIIRFNYEYTIKLLDFCRNEFGGGWKRNVILSMRNNSAEDTILIVVNSDDEICGFCMRMIDGNPSRFGPIGVSKKERNNGIGGVLFEAMQLEMTKRGIYLLFFLSTNEAGKRFYERHGVNVYRTFTTYKKTLREVN